MLFCEKYYDLTSVPKELSDNEVYINTINYHNYSLKVKKIPFTDIFPWKNGVLEVFISGLLYSHTKGVVTGTLKNVVLNDASLILTLGNVYLVESELVMFF